MATGTFPERIKNTKALFLFLSVACLSVSAKGQVGIGTSSPQCGLHVVDSNVAFSMSGTAPASSPSYVPVTGQGRRMMWIPEVAAFRVGYVNSTEWDAANIGPLSTAIGTSVIASGMGAIAIGFSSTASGLFSLALGQSCISSGVSALSLGRNSHARGDYSLVLGERVATSNSANSVQYTGAMMLGDHSTTTTTYASADNEMTMRFAGGYRLFSNSGLSAGVTMSSGAGSWSSVSDRNKKENFTPVNTEEVLQKIVAMPVTRWNYKSQPVTQQHIGPMAQDFYAAFGLDGVGNDTTINTIDIDGVNMAAIQALEQRTRDLQQQNEMLQAKNAALEERLKAIEEYIGKELAKK